jgi:stage III sporulation protein AD
MEIFQIVGFALIATVLVLIVREHKPNVSFLLAIFAGIVIFLLIVGKIADVMKLLGELAAKSNVDMIFLQTILKIIGIAYIAEFGAQIVRDAGQEAIASKIELAGKILIMVLAIPIITVIVETVLNLLPT